MKKNLLECLYFGHFLFSILSPKPMILFLIVSLNAFQIQADTVKKTESISLSFENAALKEIFREIEEKTNYRFFYSTKAINESRKVSITLHNVPIEAVVSALLGNSSDLSFKIRGDQIMLKRAKKKNEILDLEISADKEVTGEVSSDNNSPSASSLSASFVKYEITVRGTVTSETGDPMPGVNIIQKGTANGTTTDAAGKYSLLISEDDAVLVFSFIGYASQEVQINGRSVIDVVLLEDVQRLSEVVVVGYGERKKENLTGAISNITSKEILTTTHTSLAQSLSGKISGLQIRQNTGQPGTFDNSINIRGFGTPLYVIDGIVRGDGSEFQRLNPEDIESISVLKDASAAIYGMNAANGVIIVTTKRGGQGKTTFRINSGLTIATPTSLVKSMNAPQHMTIRNDAEVNAGRKPYLSKEELDKWNAGVPGYESTDWTDLSFKSTALIQQHNFSAQGGNETLSYFSSFGYQNEESFLRSGDMSYKKYTFRSNLTANFTKNLVARLDISGRFDERLDPGYNFETIYNLIQRALPNERLYVNNDPKYLATSYNTNPLAATNASISGFSSYKNKAFQSTGSLTYTVPFIKGLIIKGVAAFDSNNGIDKAVSKSYRTYTYLPPTEFTPDGTYVARINRFPSTISNTYNDFNNVTLQAQLNYNTKISDNHNIEVTLASEQTQGFTRSSFLRRQYDTYFTNPQIDQASTTNQQTGGDESERRRRSYLGRFNYDYKDKYLLEYAFRYDGSYRYAPASRWGFFPVVSAGWRLSEENFIKNNFAFVSNLKIRGSYGLIGEDAGSPFQYIAGFTTTGGGGYEFTNGTFTAGAGSPSITNESLTWTTSTIKDIGVEFGFFQDKLYSEIDVYQRDREGLLASRAVSVPNTFGASLPQENLNSDRTLGIDFSIGHRNNIGDFRYSVNANFNFGRTMRRYVERSPFTSSMERWRSGTADRWNDIVWGYDLIGQFQDWDDVLLSPGQSSLSAYSAGVRDMPGDYKFRDVNNDGVINSNDRLPLWFNGTPKRMFGFTLSAQWRGFDITALFQGSGGYTLRWGENLGLVFNNDGNSPAFFYDRWHLSDPYDPNSAWVPGKYPPTRLLNDVGSHLAESAAWRFKTSFLRFKSLDLGYTFASATVKEIGLNSIRVYVNSFNLYTWADSFLKPMDPERFEGRNPGGWTYPLTTSLTFGINAAF